MKILYTNKFEQQRKQYSFCFTCEDCMYFDKNQSVCAHEYPNKEHSISYYLQNTPPEAIIFCKQFELG